MQAEYYRRVIDYIAGLFVYYRKDLAGKSLKVGKSIKRGKWITVNTRMVYANGKTAPVKWRVYDGGGAYRVGDVNIQGVWLSLRMRDKFVSILNRNKGDFGALLDYLRDNAA
jgi:phospholipid transport system substrate-binding protein